MVARYHVDDRADSVVLLDTATGEVRDLLSFTGSLHGGDISADGSTVALSFNRWGDPAQPKLGLYLIDTVSGSMDDSLLLADGDLFHPHLSADGSVLAFSSYADNLPVGIGNDGSDAVVFDRHANVMTFAYTTIDGDVADDQSVASAISADGSIVIIGSSASNLGGAGPLGGAVSVSVRSRDRRHHVDRRARSGCRRRAAGSGLEPGRLASPPHRRWESGGVPL
jgi:Tol biopolymer transport system component